jgi:hypothetical protein
MKKITKQILVNQTPVKTIGAEIKHGAENIGNHDFFGRTHITTKNDIDHGEGL